MDITFRCGHCGQVLVVDERGAGLVVQCPKCNSNVAIPAHQTVRFVSPVTSVAQPLAQAAARPLIWNPSAAANWSLLLLPLGAFLHAKNWQVLGQTSKAKANYIWAWAMIGLVVILSFLPFKIPWMFGAIILGVWWFSQGRAQVEHVKQKFAEDYDKKKWHKPLLIGLACLVGYAILMGVISTTFEEPNWGERLEFNGSELYYTSGVQKEDAMKLGKVLTENGWFKDDKKTLQLTKSGSTWEFRLVIKKGLENDQEVIDMMKRFAAELSRDVFNGQKVDIHLCDEHLKTVRVVVAF